MFRCLEIIGGSIIYLTSFCIVALELDKCYMKARLRRAQAYEAQEKLEDAFEGLI